MNFFKRLFCRHEGKLEHVCDTHGDEIFFLDKAVLAVETPAQWPKENPHIPKEVVTNG